MKAVTWNKVSELFCGALDLAPPERAAYLDRSGVDAEVRGEVERLLDLHESSGRPLPDPGAFLRVQAPGPGTRIGQYTLQRVLGTGGMGTVFEALQSRPQRTVALKTMRMGLSSLERVQRFLFEAEVLGNLRHPSIAQIYEAGTHREGDEIFPWFAMELVPGARDLIDYARAKGLTLEARLALFSDVCDAVHHGHQKGVIHRDLKAGNILVDADGRVKVIDFGVARATQADASAVSLTQAGQIIGTLSTMSPEQLAGDPAAVDARSDVYSLGVVLYELVTEKRPYVLDGLGLADALRRLREARPPRTSGMPLELHWILLRALEKDPARRYPSASEFAADLRRFARHEPVSAGPPSRLYLARKLVQRHTLAVAASAAVLVALVAGMLGTSWQASEARAGRRAAETESATTRAVAGFLDELLSSADPELARGKELTARELLDLAAQKIDGAFPGRPAVESAVRTTIGRSYDGLGHFAEAERHLRIAHDLARRTFGDEHERTLETASHLTWALYDLERYAEAAEAGRTNLEKCRRVLGDGDPRTWRAVNQLVPSLTFLAQFEEAERLLLALLEEIRSAGGADQREENDALSNLAFNSMEWGRYSEAARYYRDALTTCRRTRGDDAPETLILIADLANCLVDLGEFPEAEELFDEAVASSVRVLGAQHPRTLFRRTYRADLWVRQKKLDQAEREYRDLIASNPELIGPLNGLALCLQYQGRFQDAVEVARAALALGRATDGPENLDTVTLQENLAHYLHLVREMEEAIELMEPAEAALSRALGPDHPRTLGATYELALLLRDLGERESARSLIAGVVEAGSKRPDGLPFLEEARRNLERLEAQSTDASGGAAK